MKKSIYYFLSFILMYGGVFAQDQEQSKIKPGHTNTNKFRQLYDEFATPNMFRTGSGAPGPAYYQQEADYKMDVVLDDKNTKLSGFETITYTNNSPDDLKYLWVQLDQNVRAKDSKSPLIEGGGYKSFSTAAGFVSTYMKDPFDGGFNIQEVKDIKYFPKDGNRTYEIAQFYPRMAVYNDVEGWQNSQFWGRDEFALPFGNFEVNITVPADHILDGTGTLMNKKEVFSKTMLERYEQAKKSYDKPVIIVTQAEAEAAEKGFSKGTKIWRLQAENVRDFAFATSRKFIWDMMAVKIGNKDVMAVSLYPKEGNPLWEEWSTRTVASTLQSYSSMTFDYPYHKAISVHAKNQGMEYPMICWNYGRPNEDGTYSDRVKYGMMGVIVHEVGHNFFPMIVNSDERQWTWMDEGLNTFVQYIAEQDFGKKYPSALSANDKNFPSDRGPAKLITRYMGGDQDFIAPIMSKGLDVFNFGENAYGKPATALNILRETIMGFTQQIGLI